MTRRMDDFVLFILIRWLAGFLCGWLGRAWWVGRGVTAFEVCPSPATLRAFAAFDDKFGAPHSSRARRHHKS